MNICKHNDFCGGCIYQGMDYGQQLRIKEDEVLRLMAEKALRPERPIPLRAVRPSTGTGTRWNIPSVILKRAGL